jgi:carbonic anhydrase
LLASSLETAELTPQGFRDMGRGPGSREGEYIDWLTIKDQQQAVIDDVEPIRKHPLVPEAISVHGYIYDVHSGRLIEVQAEEKAALAFNGSVSFSATAFGRARSAC